MVESKTDRKTVDMKAIETLQDMQVDYFCKCQGFANTLKTEWETALSKAKPELEKYRGWGNFLANLATCGISMLVALYISGGKKVLYPILTSSSSQLVDTMTQTGLDVKLRAIDIDISDVEAPKP